MEDRISEMPEQILHSILSFLTLKEATASSILSKRWKDLSSSFVALTSTLNLDVANMIGYDQYDKEFWAKDNQRCEFVRWADKILQLHQHPKVYAFRVQFYLSQEFAYHLDRWIANAVDKGVQELDLDLDMSHKYPLGDNLYNFPCWLFPQYREPHIKHLFLNSCILRLPPDFSAFSSLLAFSLENVLISEEDILYIMSNCLLLESLKVRNCPSIVCLKIDGPCPQLKHLCISRCHHLENIEIVAINLLSFEYIGTTPNLSFKFVPQLVTASICTTSGGMTYALDRLPCDIPRLETLLLFSPTMKENVLPAKLSMFTNLKKLVLTAGRTSNRGSLIPFTATFLKACPFLQKFMLHLVAGSPCKEVITEAKLCSSECTHNQLKEVQISGFRGSLDEIELASYIMRIAVVLEKMTIDPKVADYQGEGKWNAIDGNKLWSNCLQKSICKSLSRLVPPHVLLIVL
ncbi:F-box/LRR-repeat protein At3g58900-like [Macadamia integrifolia]|uniref:F-box/LRR-repeat protein At3g58900-like n=1 Tax=Macadamia integrifolia TaxID=60698 RepID=UPI001C4E7E82|nr:F-box/LRR-repeat protein At3g58900-like [Macadamia integrifolia]XP_042513672.1 F-box/LRR-repeat protein At3g58900-like [Macadamia integrifolia]XP_042513673.1 F-box/LRR-repeat protein At3g58900-like [Macadamia integrifolia]